MFYRKKNGKITINKNGTMPNSKICGCCAGGGSGGSGSCFVDDCPQCSLVHLPPFFNNFLFSENTPCVNTFSLDINGETFTLDCYESFENFTDANYFEDEKYWYSPDDKNPLYSEKDERWKIYRDFEKQHEELQFALEDAIASGDAELIEYTRIALDTWLQDNEASMAAALDKYNAAKHEFNMHTIEEASANDICASGFRAESHFRTKDKKIRVDFIVSLTAGVVEGFSTNSEDCRIGAEDTTYTAHKALYQIKITPDDEITSAHYTASWNVYTKQHIFLTGVDTEHLFNGKKVFPLDFREYAFFELRDPERDFLEEVEVLPEDIFIDVAKIEDVNSKTRLQLPLLPGIPPEPQEKPEVPESGDYPPDVDDFIIIGAFAKGFEQGCNGVIAFSYLASPKITGSDDTEIKIYDFDYRCRVVPCPGHSSGAGSETPSGSDTPSGISFSKSITSESAFSLCESKGLAVQLEWEFKPFAKTPGYIYPFYPVDLEGLLFPAYSAYQHNPLTGEEWFGEICDCYEVLDYHYCSGGYSTNEQKAAEQRAALERWKSMCENTSAALNSKIAEQNKWTPVTNSPVSVPGISREGRMQKIIGWAGEREVTYDWKKMIWQFYHEMYLKQGSLPLGAIAVEVEINGVCSVVVPIGGKLSLNELMPLLPGTLLTLPETTISECYEEWEDYEVGPLVWSTVVAPKARAVQKDLLICVTQIIYAND